MSLSDLPVFVFEYENSVSVFPELRDAASRGELLTMGDKILPEYMPLIYTLDGRRINLASTKRGLEFVVSDTPADRDVFFERLRVIRAEYSLQSNPDDPLGLANELIERRYNELFPNKPGWISRLLGFKGSGAAPKIEG